MGYKICAVCRCPYIGASCPICASKEYVPDEIDFDIDFDYEAEDV